MPGAFDDILDANARYAEGFSLAGLPAPAALGLGVLTCIDSRIEPLAMLGVRPGDAKILRNAGARVTDDVIRSLALATHLLAVRRIMIVSHTNCAMATSNDDLHVRMHEVNPSLELGELDLLAASSDPRATVRTDLLRLRESGALAPGTVVGAFRYDVDTGLLMQLDEQAG